MKGILFLVYIFLPLALLDGTTYNQELDIKKLVSLNQNKHCQKPQRDDVVTMHYVAKLPDGTIIHPYEKNVKFQMGSKSSILGIGRVASELCIGEKAWASIPSYMAYQDGHEAIGVPPHSPLIIEIELVHAVRRHPIDLFHDTDVNKDGKINQIEMVNLLRKQNAFEHEMMRRKGLDAQVEEILLEYEDTVNDVLRQNDLNGDGYLTPREYLQDEL